MDERIFIYLDGKIKFPITCPKSINLNELRKTIHSKNISNFLYLIDDNIIQEEDEENFLISDSVKEGKLYIISNKPDIYAPIPGSILKSVKEVMKIYSYPQEELTEIEKVDSNNTKNILFIGKSGDGKTTFINALINVLLNIKGENDLRYKLAFEDSDKEQDKSQTQQIRIYNVKIENKPILRLIDSPGFFDTEGKDDIHIEQFRNFFQNEISYLHCICFIMNFSSYRRDYSKIELCQKISNLFAEEIKNNFIFIFTHYTFIGDFDPKESLLKDEVFKDIINDNNIFKLDSECAFTGEKTIRNYIWGKSTIEIKKIINEKFYKLKPINTAQSAEVIKIRNELNQLFNHRIKEFKSKLNEIRDLLKNDSLTYKKKINVRIKSKSINTNCMICNKTCQVKCECDPLLNIRYFCNIFNFFGLCKECDCHFIRHKRENIEYKEKEEIMKFKDEEEKDKSFQEDIKLLENNIKISFMDINTQIDKNILTATNADLQKSFSLYYGGIEEGSYEKLIKFKKIEATRIVLKIHNAIEDLNKLALNKTIDNNIEKFFNELKKFDDFKNDGDIIENIKKEFLIMNEGKEKNNIKFHIIRDSPIGTDKLTIDKAFWLRSTPPLSFLPVLK